MKRRNLEMKSVLFICTDNYTRSVTAEFCLKNYLNKQGIENIKVDSAGFKSESDLSRFSDAHFGRLKELGIDISEHKRIQFNETFLDEYNLIVAMGIEHKEYIFQEFNRTVPLFNELCKNEATSLVVPEPDASGHFIKDIKLMVDYIDENIEKVYAHIKTSE
jgi:protein-tyrosine-phosphatase